MGKFTIFNASNSQFYFNLKADNGEKILSSEGYIFKSSCQNGIQSVKANSPFDSRYEKRIAVNGKFYFVLKGPNNEIIGTSELYESSQGRDNGIKSVKENAPNASIVDLTLSISH